MGEWYTESFGEDYLIVYRHRSSEDARREIGAMMEWMSVPAHAEVLDIGCGMGRHALALKGLGYRVTGLDLSEVLLSEARRSDPEGTIDWVQGDMRELPFADGSFDATVNWFTSFGYFEESGDNVRVLREMKRVLKPQGRFLIDFLNPAYLKQQLVPRSERVDGPTGLRIEETRSIENGFVVKKIRIGRPSREEEQSRAGAASGRGGSEGLPDGGSAGREYVERVRLIGLEQFERMFEEAGLVLERLYGDYDGSPYAAEHSKRLVLLGRRGE